MNNNKNDSDGSDSCSSEEEQENDSMEIGHYMANEETHKKFQACMSIPIMKKNYSKRVHEIFNNVVVKNMTMKMPEKNSTIK